MLSAVRQVAGALVALALLTPAADAKPRIVGGMPAPSGAYPFMAQVEVDGAFACGGSLVAARYVLTAAHCFTDPPAQTVEVVLGTTVLGDPQAPRHAATVVGPPAELDLAVLRLTAPSAVPQVRFPRPEDAPLHAPGLVGRALGWGATNPEQPTAPSPTLQQVDLFFRPDADCPFENYDPGVTLCAGDPAQRRDTCNGDSGGPLLAPDGLGGVVLAGATSYGDAQCGNANGAYVELTSAQVNGPVRDIVPQVEVSPNGATVLAGDPVTFTATPRDPDGAGPFGGYDRLVWDVDGDGFDDADGQTTVTVTAREGLNAVAVRATDAVGNDEVRRAGVTGREASVVVFATDAVRVREGRTARLTLLRGGQGSGTVVATPSDGSAPLRRLLPNAGPAMVSFDPDEATSTLPYVLRDDERVERAKTFALTLSDATGDLRIGAPDRVVVTVQDDDADLRLPRPGRRPVGRRGFTVPVDPNTTGRLEAAATLGGRTVARAGRRRIRSARRRDLRLRLTAFGARRVARDGPLKVHVAVRLEPTGGGLPARANRAVRVG